MFPEIDPTEEGANIRRIAQAGINNQDDFTQAVAVARASRLAKKTHLDITNPTVATILKLDCLTRKED